MDGAGLRGKRDVLARVEDDEAVSISLSLASISAILSLVLNKRTPSLLWNYAQEHDIPFVTPTNARLDHTQSSWFPRICHRFPWFVDAHSLRRGLMCKSDNKLSSSK